MNEEALVVQKKKMLIEIDESIIFNITLSIMHIYFPDSTDDRLLTTKVW